MVFSETLYRRPVLGKLAENEFSFSGLTLHLSLVFSLESNAFKNFRRDACSCRWVLELSWSSADTQCPWLISPVVGNRPLMILRSKPSLGMSNCDVWWPEANLNVAKIAWCATKDCVLREQHLDLSSCDKWQCDPVQTTKARHFTYSNAGARETIVQTLARSSLEMIGRSRISARDTSQFKRRSITFASVECGSMLAVSVVGPSSHPQRVQKNGTAGQIKNKTKYFMGHQECLDRSLEVSNWF